MRDKVTTHNGPELNSVNGFSVIDCRDCGFKHLLPIPAVEDLEQEYRHEYYSREKPLYLERHRQDLDWWNLVYGERYDLFEQLLPAQRRRLLDVGSGPGYFLLHGQERGWQTTGIEPSRQAFEHSRSLGLEIVNDFLTEDKTGHLGLFDVIHLNEVLEHIPAPLAMLRIVHSLLNPGGLVCIMVPNDYSPFQEALQKACGFQPWWVAPPHHINYFDFASLKRTLERTGFEVVHQEATFPIDLFLLMGDNYVGNDDLGRQCHGRRKTFEHNLSRAGMPDLKQKLYSALASVGIGREVVMTARRREESL